MPEENAIQWTQGPFTLELHPFGFWLSRGTGIIFLANRSELSQVQHLCEIADLDMFVRETAPELSTLTERIQSEVQASEVV